MSDRIYKCAACGGDVEPGKTGLLRGLSSYSDGHPGGAIKDSIDVVHYLKYCKNPDNLKKTPFPSLGSLE